MVSYLVLEIIVSNIICLLVYKLQIKQKDRLKALPVLHLLVALIFIIDLSHVPENRIKDWIFSVVYFIAFVFLLIAGIFYKKILHNVLRHFRCSFSNQCCFLLVQSISGAKDCPLSH